MQWKRLKRLKKASKREIEISKKSEKLIEKDGPRLTTPIQLEGLFDSESDSEEDGYEKELDSWLKRKVRTYSNLMAASGELNFKR